MFRFTILLFGFVILTSNCEADVKSFCQAEWSGDYVMQEYCLKQQENSNHDVVQRAQRKNIVDNDGDIDTSGDYGKILARCLSEWRIENHDSFDWVMAKYCVEQQVNSYANLK